MPSTRFSRVRPGVVIHLAIWILCIVYTRPVIAGAASVVIVRPHAADPLALELLVRLRGELVADQFEVVAVEHPLGNDPATELTSLARDVDAVAVIAVLVEPGAGAQVWIDDRGSAPSRVRRIDLEQSGHASSAVLAVQAIEILRASVLARLFQRATPEAAPERAEPVADAVPIATVPVVSRSPSRLWVAEVGGQVLASFEQVRPAISPLIRFGHSVSESLEIRVAASAFGTRPTTDGPLASARIDQKLALIEVMGLLASNDHSLRPVISLGGGVHRLGVEGTAPLAPNVAVSNSLWSAALDAGLGGRVRLSTPLSLGLELHALVLWPYPMVRIGDHDAGRIGRPTMLASATLQVWP